MTLSDKDTALAAKIAEAVKAVDVADATRIERAKAAGLLLHEAHKRHPGRKAFEAFLKLTDGLQYSRAMELIGVAIDRKSYDKLSADNAARKKKHRDKKKLHKPEPKVLPKPIPESSVTSRTNGLPEVSAEARSAEFARLYPDDGAVTDPPIAPDAPKPTDGPKVDEYISQKALVKFMAAVDSLFPQMNFENLHEAYLYVQFKLEDLGHELVMRKAS